MGTRGNKGRVAVGLSGGVDSAVTAALLMEQGYKVTGVYLECWDETGCRTDQDRKDALEVALKLEIPYRVLDFKREYREKVVEYFYREYEAGRTPNPDTVCNREIKFGLFYRWAIEENGFDYVATGHYARIRRMREETRDKRQEAKILRQVQDDEYVLVRGKDENKDQSYFLYQLRPEQLGRILFPVGGMTKQEVRAEARRIRLPVAEKPDSQGICFIGEVEVRDLLKKRIKPKVGEVVVAQAGGGKQQREMQGVQQALGGKRVTDLVIGRHEGVWFYTIGQRLGKELDRARIAQLCKEGKLGWDPRNLAPLFVVEKDVERNRLVVGVEEDLKVSEFEVGEINWLVADSRWQEAGELECCVRIWNLGEMVPARVTSQESRVKIKTGKPLRGVAEGQACVFYSSDGVNAVVLGGGVIVA